MADFYLRLKHDVEVDHGIQTSI